MTALLRKTQKKTTSIGVDIGHSAARAVQMIRKGNQYTLVRASRISIKSDENQKDTDDSLSRVFERLLSTVLYQGRNITMGVGSPEAELHTLELPSQILNSSADQLDQAINLELSRVLQNTTDEMQTAWWPLPRSGGAHQGVIGVAMPADRVKALWNACRKSGYTCNQIDVLACAAARFGQIFLNQKDTRSVWGILDIGHHNSHLILCIAGKPVLVRKLTVSSNVWTEKIAKSLQISYESAEVEKCECGISLEDGKPGESANRAPQQAVGSMISHIIQDDLATLAARIERSFSYILQYFTGVSAGELVLIGKGARLTNLDQYLQDSLGIPVYRADQPSENSLLIDERGPSCSRLSLCELACAIGLAIEPEEEES